MPRKKNEVAPEPKRRGRKKKLDPESEALLDVAKTDLKRDELAVAEAQRKQEMALFSMRLAGRAEMGKVIREFADISNLIQLKQIKDSKAYKELPTSPTWAKYCEFIGLSHQHVDEGLRNLQTLGENFLQTVSSFGLGYRDLRKLRKLSGKGVLQIEDQSLVVEGEVIPLDPDHKDDLQAALERVIDARDADIRTKDRLIESKEDVIKKQERELRKLEKKARGKDMTPTETAMVDRIEDLKIAFDGYMLRAEPPFDGLAKDEEPTPRMIAAYMSLLHQMKRHTAVAYERAVDMYGRPEIDGGWQPPEA